MEHIGRYIEQVINGLIFDFGGVFTKTWRRKWLWQRCEAAWGLEPGSLSELLFTGQHWWDVSTGKASAEVYWQQVRRALGGRIPPELAPFEHNPFAYEELNRSTVSLVRELHRRYKVALLSNATVYLDSLLVEHQLMDLFDVVVNSARVGLRKPDPEIYRLTYGRLGLLPSECLFIDDKERNTQVAQALGMDALVFRSVARLVRELPGAGIQIG
jgi:epoxide hydrolase-like predicted phosphatase